MRSGNVLGEGPLWDAATGTVWWVDITAQQVWRATLDGAAAVAFTHHEPVGCLALATTGELLGMTPTGLWRLAPDPVLLVATPEPDLTLRANDGKADPAGRMIVGTMGFPQPVAEAGTLWSYSGGTATPLLRGLSISNGLAWTADGATMYFVDSWTQSVQAFEYDVSTGAVGGVRVLAALDPADGGPDGITIDADDGVWVAVWGGGKLHRYDGRGALTDVVRLPVRYPTCPAFVGPDLDRLVVTSATQEYRDSAPPDGAGDVYLVDPGVRGAAAHQVDLARVVAA